MLVNEQLMRICEEILKEDIAGENFGNLLIETGVKLEDQEWDIPNKLLEKSNEVSHLIGGRDVKTIH